MDMMKGEEVDKAARTAMTWSEISSSRCSSGLSNRMKTRSKRDNTASLIFKFSATVLARLHIPPAVDECLT